LPGLLPDGQWGRPFAIASVIETRCASMYVNATGSAVSAVTAVKLNLSELMRAKTSKQVTRSSGRKKLK
jgi:hypothetical protein